MALHLIYPSCRGIGKTTVATILAQYLAEPTEEGATRSVWSIDIGNAQPDLLGFKALQATVRNPDWEEVCTVGGLQSDLVIDCGAGACKLLLEPSASDLELTVHFIVVGGSAQTETLIQLKKVTDVLPKSVKVIVWLNDFFGPIESPTGGGFETMRIFKENQHKISGVVPLSCGSDLFRHDLRDMIHRRLTFAEALDDPSIWLFSRQRLVMLKREMFARLGLVV